MGLLSGIFGSGGSGDTAKALETIQNVPLPVLKEYYPELYQQVVSLNPEMESAVNLGPSEMQGIATDPSLRAAQMKALNKLQGIGDAGGMDSQFLADQSRLESDINTNTRGREEAIMQNLDTRGMAGGMSELVARNQAVQSGANTQAQMAMDKKAQADQRALQALISGGQMGGQMQAQDFSQAAQKAQAADSISKFNAANQQQVIGNNAATKNNAQQWNATNAQNTANSNTGLSNQSTQYNLDIAQRKYDNEMKKAQGVAGAYGNSAASKDAARNGEMQLVGGLIGAGAAAYGAKK